MWFVLALVAAACTAAADVLTKKAAAGRPAHILALARWLYALPVLAVLIPFVETPRLSPKFFGLLAVMVPLEIAAIMLYIRAITTSPLSLSVPFLSFTPALLLGTSALFLGERVPPSGLAGVLLVAFGAYCMNLPDLKKGLLEPFRAILRKKGPRYMLAVAAIYSVTSALVKFAINETGPYFFSVFYVALLAAVFVPVLAAAGRPVTPVFAGWRALLPIGIAIGAGTIAQFVSYTMAPVAYAIAVKRLSLVLGVIAGRVFFGEGGFAERLTGSAMMLAGVALITLA
ncbi:MAG: EamA family transporter [Deltaproteobacteria bacterium]|nr:EamA family transporter [Deltaproteobacteria bacterium]